jgi:hypothetical protein
MSALAETELRDRADRLEVTIVDDIDDIAKERWDAHLDPDDLQASHRFVAACQRANVEEARYRHVLIARGGRTVATASLTCIDIRLELLAGPTVRHLVHSLRSLHPGLLRVPVVLGGLPVSFGQSCLRIADGQDPGPILERIDAEATRMATDEGAGLICFKEMSETEAQVADGLLSLGYFRAASLPSCRLRLPFQDMQTLTEAMRSGYRRQLRRTERDCEDENLSVREWSEWETLESTFFELYERVMDKAEYQMERLNRDFIRELRSAFRERASLITVERDGGEVLACAIMLHGTRRSTFLLAGIRYSDPDGLLAYRRVVLETVASALRRGAHTLEMGQTSYGTKMRLGAKTVPRYLYLRHLQPLFHQTLEGLSETLFPERTLQPHHVFRS